MKITFLGVGSAFSRKNANSNVLIEHGTLTLLIDCSHSCPASLEKCGLSIKDITHSVITHFHGDHTSGLEELAFMTRLVHKTRITLLSTESLLDRLWNYTMRGALEFIELTPGNGTPQTLDDFFASHPLPVQEWVEVKNGAGLHLYLHPTDHVQGMESYGVEVKELPGDISKRFLFSSDTKFDEQYIRNAHESCSVIFHDCQLFDSGENNRMGVHTSYRQLLQLPRDIRRKMWLYHYGDTRPLPDAEKDGFAGFVHDRQSFVL